MVSTYVFDVEIYKNYFLVRFKNVETGKFISFEMAYDEEIDRKALLRVMTGCRIVGFNSKNFDIPIIFGAIAGYKCAALKRMADDIIVGGMKPWEIEEEWKLKIPRNLNHIDLIEVAPGQASLKIYNGCMHGKLMQDLPIEPSAELTDEEIDLTFEYCGNDLAATQLLFEQLSDQIRLREVMGKEYGEDLRSKSDAQVAEAVIKSQVGALLGEKPKKPDKVSATARYLVPNFIKFRSRNLNKMLDAIEDATFRVAFSGKIIMPEVLTDASIEIGSGVYRMGIGGLHSSEKCQAVRAGENHILVDRDVASYYPAIIINQGLAPKHLGWAFLKVYKRLVARRLKAKADAAVATDPVEKKRLKEAADALKIAINGSFGKLGSPFSALYSPDLLIQTTVTGQLCLLMLIERMEDEDIPVVSANTDGIVIRCPKDRVEDMKDVVAEWERDTGFATEETPYAALYSRDVNNYIAVKPDGEVKLKGCYAKSGLRPGTTGHKNPTTDIVTEAVIEHISKGKSLYKHIRECTDIRKFVTVRTVKGGAIANVKEVIEPRTGKRGQALKPTVRYSTDGGEYLGKAIRFYYSTEVSGAIHYKEPNSSGTHNKVPKSDGARPCMTLPDELPDDIDYGWYVREARDILVEIGFHEALF